MRVGATVRGLARGVVLRPLPHTAILRDDVVAASAEPRVGNLVLVDEVEVLLQVAALVEAHVAPLEHAVEWLFLGVYAQVCVKLTDAAKDLHARPQLLRVAGHFRDGQIVVRPRFHALALVKTEHLLLVVFLEVVNDEVMTVRDVLLLAAQGESVLQ